MKTHCYRNLLPGFSVALAAALAATAATVASAALPTAASLTWQTVMNNNDLMPHAPAMKRNLAESLGIPEDAVSIKATTTEGMNAEGRGEGISAHAVALLQKR